MIGSFHRKAIPVVAALLIAGCANIEDRQEFHDRDSVSEKANNYASIQEQQLLAEPVVVEIEGIYLGEGRRGPLDETRMLPPSANKDITLFDSRALSLHGVAERIEDATGISVKVRQTTLDDSGAALGMNGSPDDMIRQVLEAGVPAPQNSMRVQYSGKLSDFLDRVAARFDVTWAYRGGEISIAHLSTRTYQVALLAGEVTQSASMSNSSGGGGGGGGLGKEANYADSSGEIKTEFTADHDPWVAIKATMEGILGGKGTYALNPTSSSVVVTSTPSGHEEVKEYIDSYNDVLTRQVALNVSVFTLQLDDSSNIGFNLNAVYKNLAKDYRLHLSGPRLGSNIGGQFTANLFNGADSRFAGSDALIQALKEWGETSIVTSATGVVLNGQPFPIMDVNRKTYLAETKVNQVSEAGTSVSLTPGTVTTGFSMQVVPQILSKDQMLLQYAFSLSSLTALVELSSGDQTIQGPDVDERSFIQRSLMPVGSTLVIAGFQRDEDSVNQRAGGSGVSRSNGASKTMVFVTITANRA